MVMWFSSPTTKALLPELGRRIRDAGPKHVHLLEADHRIYRLGTGDLTPVQTEGAHSDDNVIAFAREMELL